MDIFFYKNIFYFINEAGKYLKNDIDLFFFLALLKLIIINYNLKFF